MVFGLFEGLGIVEWITAFFLLLRLCITREAYVSIGVCRSVLVPRFQFVLPWQYTVKVMV